MDRHTLCSDLRQALFEAGFGPTGVARFPAALRRLLQATATMYSRHPHRGWSATTHSVAAPPAPSAPTRDQVHHAPRSAPSAPTRDPSFRVPRQFHPRLTSDPRDLDEILAGAAIVVAPLPVAEAQALAAYGSLSCPGFVVPPQVIPLYERLTQTYQAACARCAVHPRRMEWLPTQLLPRDIHVVVQAWYRQAGAVLNLAPTDAASPTVTAFRAWFEASPEPWQRLWALHPTTTTALRSTPPDHRPGAVPATTPDDNDSTASGSDSSIDFAPATAVPGAALCGDDHDTTDLFICLFI
jgi:hypothetical protein